MYVDSDCCCENGIEDNEITGDHFYVWLKTEIGTDPGELFIQVYNNGEPQGLLRSLNDWHWCWQSHQGANVHQIELDAIDYNLKLKDNNKPETYTVKVYQKDTDIEPPYFEEDMKKYGGDSCRYGSLPSKDPCPIDSTTGLYRGNSDSVRPRGAAFFGLGCTEGIMG
ncbi:MAG: hypothetical protein ACYSR1_04870 [Planctomycetota bacterium]